MRHLLRTCSIAMKCIVGYWLFSTMACFDCFHIKNSYPQIIQEATLLIDLFTKLSSQNWPNNEFDNYFLALRLCLVAVKRFPENRYFLEMLFSGKENVFMCLVAFQKKFRKIFSDVWLYS